MNKHGYTVIEIVSEWLKENGYDGLCGDECGCILGDLMCCDSDMSLNCQPAYSRKCNQDKYNCGGCDGMGAGGGEKYFCMTNEKPNKDDKFTIEEKTNGK